MNHGYCQNCWWWEPIKFDLKEAKWVLGVCWMWNNTQEHESYCPDYWNRNSGNKKEGSLENWIKNLPDGYEYPEDTKFKKI